MKNFAIKLKKNLSVRERTILKIIFPNIIFHIIFQHNYFLFYREVWPEDDCFGSLTAAPEDELMLLREIFFTDLGHVTG